MVPDFATEALDESQMEQRKSRRVVFERGYDAHMMAIDGTWRRSCKIEDVSDTGAKLGVEGSLDGLSLQEFFLLLSSTGLAFRRCELSWVNGDNLGVYFKRAAEKKSRASAQMEQTMMYRALSKIMTKCFSAMAA